MYEDAHLSNSPSLVPDVGSLLSEEMDVMTSSSLSHDDEEEEDDEDDDAAGSQSSLNISLMSESDEGQ